MKTFEEYRLRVKHSAINTSSNGNKNINLIFPNFDTSMGGNVIYKGLSTVQLPANAKWVIWNDPYHKMQHLNYFPEFVANLGWRAVDFEDINPSLIVKAFDTLEEAARYMLNSNSEHYELDETLEEFINGFDENSYEPGSDLCVTDDEDERKRNAIEVLISALSQDLDIYDTNDNKLEEDDLIDIELECIKANKL